MVSVVIPAYNEEKGIAEVVKRVKRVLPEAEIIVVDDGSSDNTYNEAKKTGVKVIKHSFNMGKANALRTGYKHAKSGIIVNIDGDCSYPPEEMPKLVKKIGEFDMVVGSRFKGGFPKGLPFLRILANMGGSFLLSILFLKRVTDATSGLRAFRKGLTKLDIKSSGLEYEVEFTARTIKEGYRYAETPIKFENRRGKSKLKFFRHTIKFLLVMIRTRFS